jgi:hypothetical protein
MSTLGALSLAWIGAEAALPLGWKLTGLRREGDSERWVATARGQTLSEDTATGHGDDPVQALHRLEDALRERPNPGDMRDRNPPPTPA